MKKWMVALAVGSLVLMGTTVVYKEAIAKPWLCDYAQEVCEQHCKGDFSFIWCEPYDMNGNGLIDCQAACLVPPGQPIWPCWWNPGYYYLPCVL